MLTGTCIQNGPRCNKGIALFEGKILTNNGTTSCFAPYSEVAVFTFNYNVNGFAAESDIYFIFRFFWF